MWLGNALAVEQQHIAELIAQRDIDVAAIKAEGKDVLAVLADVYMDSDHTPTRAKIAWVYYQLGWKSGYIRVSQNSACI